ncbi:MAG: DUF3108 domain-containing protein [Rhodocyclaceae bacterium]|nr:DUF3108 domain-containing protein [Rhodocyclaceae bacterium]
MSSMRMLRWAVVISVCIHLALLLAGRGYWSSWLADDEAEQTLSVRLLPPPASAPLKPHPPPKPKTPPKPKIPRPAASSEPTFIAAPDAVSGMLDSGVPSHDMAAPSGAAMPAAPGADDDASRVPARALPGSGRMRFDVTRGEGAFIVGRAVHEWTIDGDRYELKSMIETSGIVALFADVRLGQTSVGHIDADGLHPDTFQDNRKGGEYRSVFDWTHGTLTLSNGDVVPLPPGAQDLLSMLYQFALYPLDGPELALMVTTGRKFERYVFSIEPDVELELNRAADDAPIRAYHLFYRGGDAEGVDVWLARDMERLPVKIRYTDRNGGVTEMVARDINYSGKK